MQCYYWCAEYPTAKTDTTELIISTMQGVLSLKVVVSGNGKRVNVYSGFDPGACIKTEEHRYVKALKKAVATNSPSSLAPLAYMGSVEDALVAVGSSACRAIKQAAEGGDEKVTTHWQMMLGEIEAQPKTTEKTAVRTKETSKPKVDRVRELSTDPEWGIF